MRKSGRKTNQTEKALQMDKGDDGQEQNQDDQAKNVKVQKNSQEKIQEENKDEQIIQSNQKGRKKVQTQNDSPIQELQDLANLMRLDTINMTQASKSGHPTTCSSMAELLSVIFFDSTGMRYNPKNPRLFTNDKFILSKGHAAPIYYSAWSHAGFVDKKDLLNLRKFNSDLEGHPTPRLEFVDVATGSLGNGLSFAAGQAYSSKYLDKIDNRFFCLMGDGETAEGGIWEAANFASYYKLDNLIGIVDVNRLGQSKETMFAHQLETHKKRWDAFGWNAIVVDGHNVNDIIKALTKARNTKNKPTVLLAQTFKGRNFPEVEDKLNFHGVALGDKSVKAIEHINTLIKNPNTVLVPQLPDIKEWPINNEYIKLGELNYKIGDKVATRKAYGTALLRLGANDKGKRIVSADADVSNSTFSELYWKEYKDQCVECFIAEQNLVGVAQGIASRNKIVFASTFATFFLKSADQVRMGGITQTKLKYVGSHCGVSIGVDGPSQMGLEDIALFRSIPGCVVLYPSDAVSAEKAIEIAANTESMFFIRTSRPEDAVIYNNDEKFEIGQSKVVAKHEKDQLTIIGAGVTLGESLKAKDSLAKQNIFVRVIDIFCIKPLDVKTIELNARETQNTIVVVEDHYQQGGIYEAVCSGLSEVGQFKVHGFCVNSLPRSGQPMELLDYYQLTANHIEKNVKKILGI